MAVVIQVGETSSVPVEIGDKEMIRGDDGFSPIIDVEEITGGHRVDITDAEGTETFNVMHGVSPVIEVEDITDGHRVTITDAYGTMTFDVMNGEYAGKGDKGDPGPAGKDGKDGVSPSVSVSSITGGHQVSVTDASGTETFDVMDGATGQTGPQGPTGPAGPGLPSGGTDGQMLVKDGSTNYAAKWANQPTIPGAYTSNPAMDGTASAGSSGSWAKGDHVHPTDTSRQAVLGAGDIGTNLIASGAVTRAKLANDALYSPTNATGTSYNLTISDLGKTLLPSWASHSSPITINLSQANSEQIPQGAEIAIFNLYLSEITIATSGVRVAVSGDAGTTDGLYNANAHAFKISEPNTMVVLKRLYSDTTYGDMWLLLGNVEVVS